MSVKNFFNDGTRTALILVLNNLVSLAVLFGLDWDTERVAAVNSAVSVTVAFIFLLVKTGQSDPIPTTGVRKQK